ncbi:MAG TPA: IPT/TIG domain-containing protein [Candidatus Limnocylindrales bacterium]|nr:IPT/TIG domain-containing protein [Candidatus Limnocylindrales bacterium]
MNYRSRFGALCALALSAFLAPVFAQSLPGNATLQGAYYVRYLGVNGAANNCDCPVSFSGVMTFDGKGGYTLTSGQGVTNNGADHPLVTLNTGSYTVWSSGEVSLTNPFDSTNSTTLYGGVGQGAIVASSTDTAYVDLFIAIPVASGASNGTLSGTYQVASLEFYQGSFANSRNNLFTMTADGSGGLGNVAVTGSSINLNGAKTTQTSNGATYTVSANGSGTLTLPAPTGVTAVNNLLSGAKTLYVSQDGSFFIAGSPSGYDIIVGAKAPSASTKVNFSGLYFTAELDNFANGGDFAGLYGTEGASNLLGNSAGDELVHQRINPDGFDSYDETYNDAFTFNSTGVNTGSSSFALAVSANSNFAFVIGQGGDYYLQVYVKAPAITTPASGPFINPQAVVNAATNSPFTAQISPGEVITIYGSGFTSSTTSSAAPFPNTLGGVQVLLNGNPAPIYFVSPGQISAVVPFDITSSNAVVTVQVVSNNTNSNQVFTYLGTTSPGVFTVPPGGLGDGAMLHPDFSLVSAASPAKSGEAIAIYLTGLGKVNENVTAGAPAPNTTSLVNSIDVAIGGVTAKVLYAGLAPGLGGLYQVNVTVPTGVHGDVTLEISTVDGDNIQATIPIQ